MRRSVQARRPNGILFIPKLLHRHPKGILFILRLLHRHCTSILFIPRLIRRHPKMVNATSISNGLFKRQPQFKFIEYKEVEKFLRHLHMCHRSSLGPSVTEKDWECGARESQTQRRLILCAPESCLAAAQPPPSEGRLRVASHYSARLFLKIIIKERRCGRIQSLVER